MRDAFPSPAELKGALHGTLLYLGLYLVVFIQFQSYTKFYLFAQKKKEVRAKEGSGKNVSFRAIKYYNSHDILALAGDRAVGNFIEFAVAFLPLLWLHALFVDPSQSFSICAIYTASRSFYPVLFLLNKPPSILLTTVPGYAVLTYLFAQLIVKT